MLTSRQRAVLRAQANNLEVVFQVGKGEIDEALIKSTADCLAARELIKMKVLENSAYTTREAAETAGAGHRQRGGAGDRIPVCALSAEEKGFPLCAAAH